MDRRERTAEEIIPPGQSSVDADLHRAMVAAAVDVMMFVTDASGRILAWPDGASGLLARSAEDAVGRDVCEFLEQPGRVKDDLALAVRKGACRIQGWFLRGNGSRLFIEGAIRPLPDGSLMWAGMDATAHRRDAERQREIIAQLQHRIRNILANIRSIVQRSSRTSETLDDLSMHLEGRIDSIARTQQMLARSPGADLELEDIIREELLAHAAPDNRVAIAGPPVRLSGKAAEVVMFAVHELATNAVKYGALQGARGRVAISWSLTETGAEQRVRLSWIESGVQMAAIVPRREGFGAEVITRRVPYELSGTGVFELHPGGIRAIIEFPLRPGDSILASADAKVAPPG